MGVSQRALFKLENKWKEEFADKSNKQPGKLKCLTTYSYRELTILKWDPEKKEIQVRMEYPKKRPPCPDRWTDVGGYRSIWNPVWWEGAKLRVRDSEGQFESEPAHSGCVKSSSLITVVLVECEENGETFPAREAVGLSKLLHFIGTDPYYPILNPDFQNITTERSRLNVGIPVVLNDDGWRRSQDTLGSVKQPKSFYFALQTVFPIKSLIFHWGAVSKDIPIWEAARHMEHALEKGRLKGRKTTMTNPLEIAPAPSPLSLPRVRVRFFVIPVNGIVDVQELMETLNQTLLHNAPKHMASSNLCVGRGNPFLQKVFTSNSLLLTDYHKKQGVCFSISPLFPDFRVPDLWYPALTKPI